MFTLRGYQEGQLDAVETNLEQGINRILIKSPTGTGKTVTFAAMLQHKRLAKWLERVSTPKDKGARMLVLAHREELLDQAQKKIAAKNRDLFVDIEQGARRASPYCHVVVASVPTLEKNNYKRLRLLMMRHTFRVVVVDEAHHSAATTYRGILSILGFLPAGAAEEKFDDDVKVMRTALEEWDQVAPKDRVLVGFTATPNRSDSVGLGCVYQTLGFSYALKDAIGDGWLVPIEPHIVESDVDLDDVKTSRGDLNQKELARAVNIEIRNKLALAAWLELAKGLPTIAFTVDVAHAHAVAEMFNRAGVRAAAVSGETDKEERKGILRRFERGELDLIANCMVLTEGTDLPVAACILHMKPTKSATLYEQMTGRGLRPHPQDPVGKMRLERVKIDGGVSFLKPKCVVIDVVDLARKHSLMNAPVLYGLPPGIAGKGETLEEMERKVEEVKKLAPGMNLEALLKLEHLTLEELKARAAKFDPFSRIGLSKAQDDELALNWIKLGRSYRVQYPVMDGLETVVVSPARLERFDVSCTIKPRERGMPPRQRTLAADVPEVFQALTLAEQFVKTERPSVLRIVSRTAPWRSRPATMPQLEKLRQFGIRPRQGMSMGEASDAIDIAIARRGR